MRVLKHTAALVLRISLTTATLLNLRLQDFTAPTAPRASLSSRVWACTSTPLTNFQRRTSACASTTRSKPRVVHLYCRGTAKAQGADGSAVQPHHSIWSSGPCRRFCDGQDSSAVRGGGPRADVSGERRYRRMSQSRARQHRRFWIGYRVCCPK